LEAIYQASLGSKLYFAYQIYDYCNKYGKVNAEDIRDFKIEIFDADLKRMKTITSSYTEQGQPYGHFVGHENSTDDSFYYRLWRTVYTGEDNCWKAYRRDHKSSRMLAINERWSGPAHPLTDVEHSRILVLFISLYDLMSGNETGESSTNFKNRIVGTVHERNIKLTLYKSDVSTCAKNIYKMIGKNYDTKMKESIFLDARNSSVAGDGRAMTHFDTENSWQILFLRGTTDRGITIASILDWTNLADSILETLIHELLHAGLGKTKNNKYLKGDYLRSTLHCSPISFDKKAPGNLPNEFDGGLTYRSAHEIWNRVRNVINTRLANEPDNQHLKDIREMVMLDGIFNDTKVQAFISNYVTNTDDAKNVDKWVKN